jgi:hypothetical protein
MRRSVAVAVSPKTELPINCVNAIEAANPSTKPTKTLRIPPAITIPMIFLLLAPTAILTPIS